MVRARRRDGTGRPHGGDRHFQEQLCDTVAAELALGFSEDYLSYDFCDHLANVMFGWFVEGVAEDPISVGFPDFFFGVYVAFDAGEYRHPGDGEDVDPEVKYTRPLIADIVRELREA
jgi:hypothetical protein